MTWLARSAVRRPRLWLAFGIAVTAALAAGLPRLEVRTDGATLHPEGNSTVERSEQDRLRFAEPRQVLLLIGCEQPGCLATPGGFRFVRQAHAELERLSAVRGEGVQSIASLLRLEGSGDRFTIERELAAISDAPQTFGALLSQVRAHPLVDGLLLAPAGDRAAVFIPLAEHRSIPDLVEELEVWLESVPAGDFSLALTGPELAEATLGKMVLRDLMVLVPAMLGVVVVLLLGIFRNPGGAMIPMLEAGIVLLWTFGAMGWLGVPVTLVTTILPVVLMAMAITDEIHLLERLGAQPRSLSRGEAVLAALEEVGRPIRLTSVTTALGFLSFLSASIEPMRAFGLFTAFGILVAMVLTFTWIPALIVLLPEAWTSGRPAAAGVPPLGPGAPSRAILRRPALACATGALLLGAAVPGLSMLRIQDSWVDNFSADSGVVRAESDFNAAFWGSYRYDVVVDALPEFFHSGMGSALIERIAGLAGSLPHVGGVESHLILLEPVARAAGAAPPLSQLPGLALADLAMLADMSDQRIALRRLLTESGDSARVRFYVKSPNYEKSLALRAALDARLDQLEVPAFASIHASGDLPVAIELVREIVRNQLRSIGWTLALIAVVLLLSQGGPRALVAMVPVSAATLFVLGGMGLLGVPLGIATSMFASLAVGVGVDFGIHFLHRYRAERARGAEDAEALASTFQSTGAALRWNAVVLALGFAVLSLSSLKPNHSLGLLLASAMVACYFATLLLLPRLARYAVKRAC